MSLEIQSLRPAFVLSYITGENLFTRLVKNIVKYYSDGFLRGKKNPSPIGGGYTVVDENKNLIKREEFERAGFTNNEGEILGILEAAKIADIGDCISTDSMCCLAWANVGRSKARPDLNPVLMETAALIADKHINLMWERRDFNLAGIFNENEQYQRRKLFKKKHNNHRFLMAGETHLRAERWFQICPHCSADAWEYRLKPLVGATLNTGIIIHKDNPKNGDFVMCQNCKRAIDLFLCANDKFLRTEKNEQLV